MQPSDVVDLLDFARRRLRAHGCSLIEPYESPHIGPGNHVRLTTLDGVPMLVFCRNSADEKYQFETYEVDMSLTLGQFLDGLTTTLQLKFGPPEARDDTSTAYAAKIVQVQAMMNASKIAGVRVDLFGGGGGGGGVGVVSEASQLPPESKWWSR